MAEAKAKLLKAKLTIVRNSTAHKCLEKMNVPFRVSGQKVSVTLVGNQLNELHQMIEETVAEEMSEKQTT